MLELAAQLEALLTEWRKPNSETSAGFALRSHLVAHADTIIAALRLREPTGEMLQAGNRVWLDGGNERQIFEAMIDAAIPGQPE